MLKIFNEYLLVRQVPKEWTNNVYLESQNEMIRPPEPWYIIMTNRTVLKFIKHYSIKYDIYHDNIWKTLYGLHTEPLFILEVNLILSFESIKNDIRNQSRFQKELSVIYNDKIFSFSFARKTASYLLTAFPNPRNPSFTAFASSSASI